VMSLCFTGASQGGVTSVTNPLRNTGASQHSWEGACFRSPSQSAVLAVSSERRKFEHCDRSET